jgi:UDPglucose 6-dehydrogenase
MKVAVVGLWHLGLVTAGCLAKGGHSVVAFDSVPETIGYLQKGRTPISEPGLDDLLRAGVDAGKLEFTAEMASISQAEVVWVTYDTPVDNQDIADVAYVESEIVNLLPHLQQNALLIVSSQLPVGTLKKLQVECDETYPEKHITCACIPENLRLGKAIDIFLQPDRVIVGLDNPQHKSTIESLLKPFSDHLIWMTVVSAEMTKHAINAFLAISVTFINEISTLCETVGADARQVEQGLKSEERIGPKAYLRPGAAIGGGTLMRDIQYLKQLGTQTARKTFLLSAIEDSNRYHTEWSCRKLRSLLAELRGKKVAMLGLTYKAGTDTLRRSTAIETCQWLHAQGTEVNAYDPTISALPDDLATIINIKTSIDDALQQADAVVIATEWPQFRDLHADQFIQHLKQTFVVDPGGYVAKNIAGDARIQYYSVGVPT